MNRMFKHWTLSLWKKMKEREKKQEQARLGAIKGHKMLEAAAKTEAETAPVAATGITDAVIAETVPAFQHFHRTHLDSWTADLDLDDGEYQAGQCNTVLQVFDDLQSLGSLLDVEA
ncbi:hypothetical protein BGZ96_005036 [Linnemannia gamsii]|uniref:Uncharacterized protein n=1 Tax=Linnemannia gamsii TaxID=64522 RepID=A0ABQ7K605_9FUNG|nr:hypothetical protein BGZ96_005036 [Linnemannia gamsii]